MNFLNEMYKKKLIENERNVKFWEEYLQNLNSLDFNVYSDRLSVPILVPIGNKVLFRGNLKHTNEVTIALGADYFVKCSLKQAEEIRQHRIKGARLNLDTHIKEKEYLENQMNHRDSIYENPGKDIVEHCSEEEDQIWRQIHREKLREYHQNKSKEEDTLKKEIDDEELWRRLEELELQEELQNELNDINYENNSEKSVKTVSDSFIVKEDKMINVQNIEEPQRYQQNSVARISMNTPKQTPKLNLLEQIIEKQKILENKLTEIKNRDKPKTETERDILTRLDEIEQLEEFEDEMNRLDDNLLDEDKDTSEEDTSESPKKIVKQSVSFGDEDDSNTLEITFKHTEVQPAIEPYDTNKGICKPSDIYEAFSNLYSTRKKSILKKSKYGCENSALKLLDESPQKQCTSKENQDEPLRQTIIVKDVKEKVDQSSLIIKEERPMSLFKQRRQQQKKST